MFSHVTLGSDDIERSRTFYDAIMTAIGYEPGLIDEKGRCIYPSPEGVLVITKPINGDPASYGNGMTIGLRVASPEAVDAWHAAGVKSGGSPCEEPPGIRHATGGRTLYLAYLRDPDGNKLCAAHLVSAVG